MSSLVVFLGNMDLKSARVTMNSRRHTWPVICKVMKLLSIEIRHCFSGIEYDQRDRSFYEYENFNFFVLFVSKFLLLFTTLGCGFIFITDKPSKYWNLTAIAFQHLCHSVESDGFASCGIFSPIN